MTTAGGPGTGAIFAGRYRIVRLLQSGGMGAVYVAEQLATGALRALKLIHPELCANADVLRLFEQEARIGHRIPSDHIVQVIDVGVDASSGTPWLAMELLEGEDLGACVRRTGALSHPLVTEILGQIGHALAAAHVKSVIHRDLKPENVFLSTSRRDGEPLLVKLLDFGIAKVIADANPSATRVGTPLWMAPEQISGGPVSAATDVWAFGLLAFYLLTGRHYWAHADGPIGPLLDEMRHGPFPPASDRAAQLGCSELVPRGFNAWFARCVAPDPAARFPDAGTARYALPTVLASPEMEPPSGAAGPTLTQPISIPPRSEPQPPGAAYDARWYVPRPREEREIWNALAFAGKPAVLWGPSRFGKTWLLDHCRNKIKQSGDFEGFTTLFINMRLLDRGSLDSLLLDLASRIAEDHAEAADHLETLWKRPGTAGAKISRFMERHVLPGPQRGLILAIDGVDEVWQSALQDDFCALLRAWAETCDDPWPRLRLMLAVSTTPALLVSDPNRSPFNLSAPIAIPDLDEAQMEDLARRHLLPWGPAEIKPLMQLVGGHPYFARLVMHRAALHRTPVAELLDESLGPAWVLHTDVQRIRRTLELSGLLQAAARIAEDAAVKLDPLEIERLTRAGVVVEEGSGKLRLRNRLYAIAVVGR